MSFTLSPAFTQWLEQQERYGTFKPKPKPRYHSFCNGCYDPKNPPEAVQSFCGRDIPGHRPRWFYGENCLDCVTAYGKLCPRCGT